MTTEIMQFGRLEHGFFRYPPGKDGELYFGYTHGTWTFPFGVIDGKIQWSSGGTPNIYPNAEIEVIHRDEWENFGITPEMLDEFASS